MAAGQAGPRGPETTPGVPELLAAAVTAIGGDTRPGQLAMAEAVARAIETGEHLIVQAGTGTGKSLAYLVPAAAYARASGKPVVVATATLALQRQLIERDLPRLSAALAGPLGEKLRFANLKGRANYLCLHRLRGGTAEETGTLFGAPAITPSGKQMRRVRDWADRTRAGDRDELVPGVPDRVWRQVSVTGRECIGVSRCPFGGRCFAERAREAAGRAAIVVTNHALLAIDALEEYPVLPEHTVVIIDEAHDLVNRVTTAASASLAPGMAEAAARRSGRLLPPEDAARLVDAGAQLSRVLDGAPEGRLDEPGEPLAAALAVLRDTAASCAAAVRKAASDTGDDPAALAIGRAATAALDDLHATAARMLGSFGPPLADRADVVWVDRGSGDDGQPRPPGLHAAPLDVGSLLAGRLFSERTVVLTSATLAIGGSFEPIAGQWGLPVRCPPGERGWAGLDAGSPFDHPRHGILYIARHLPPPPRDGLSEAGIGELADLITAAGGRTLGLFSSMRAARAAAGALRGKLAQPLLCQGDDATGLLVRAFAGEEASCLFGTLSLWQGVDVPGPALSLVVIDRIPFPRPDDPLASARQRAVSTHGGNGFMAVAAAHAALLLAQGAGRLLRGMHDRGMVAILDPRLVTARYGDLLRRSLPPFWVTTDREVALAALRRLAAACDRASETRSPPARHA